MRRDHLFRLAMLGLILGATSPSAKGDEPADIAAAEAALKAKGLTKTLSTWVIEDETPVLAAMKDARGVFNAYAQAAERQYEAEMLVEQSKQMDQQRTMLQANLTALNQQIAQIPRTPPGVNGKYARYYQQTPANNPLMAERAELNAEMTQLNQAQAQVKSRILQPKDKAAIDDEVRKKQESFKTTLADLRKQIDEVTKKYADLAAEETVKTSIEQLKKTTKAKVKLGPSDAFLAMMKDVDKAEQCYLGKTPPAGSAATKKAKAKSKK